MGFGGGRELKLDHFECIMGRFGRFAVFYVLFFIGILPESFKEMLLGQLFLGIVDSFKFREVWLAQPRYKS